MVINDVGQMIGRQAIGFHQYLHIDLFPVNINLAAQHILHFADSFSGNLHSNDMRFSSGQFGLHLVFAQVQAVAIIAGTGFVLLLFFTQGIQTLRGTKTTESMAFFDQFGRMFGIEFTALTLTIRTVWATHIGTFIPGQTEPT